MPDPILVARGLTRIYRVGPAEIRALDGLDLDVARGEYVAVVGRSGSGKSTLLHLAGALDTPSAGSLVVDGRDLSSLAPIERALYRRTTVGFVFQSFHLVASLSAEQNVALALTFQGTFGEARRRLAREALARVGLAERASHRPGQLSGGEQQRVALARAIVHRPALLLADEPTGNLDRANADGVMALLRDVNRAGTTVLLVTHDESTARREAGRVVRLDDGRPAEAA
jgi:putative ABC transport system ATP-binding protein